MFYLKKKKKRPKKQMYKCVFKIKRKMYASTEKCLTVIQCFYLPISHFIATVALMRRNL